MSRKIPHITARQQSHRNNRRFLRSCRRRLRTGYRASRSVLPPDPTIQHLLRNLLRMAGKSYVPTYHQQSGKYTTLRLPRRFSLSHPSYAANSFLFLASLVKALHLAPTKLLQLDYGNCEQLDLDASVCMDAILRLFIKRHGQLRNLFQQHRHQKSSQFSTCGIETVRMNLESIRKFYWSIGTGQSIHGLGIEFPDILRCPLETGRQGPGCEEQIAVISTKLIDHLEACLARFNKKLTNKDITRFGNIIGEVLANAGQHSSLSQFYAIAHFVEHNAGDPAGHSGRFQITIFNFGQTIFERLQDPTKCLTHDKLWPEMESLSRSLTEWSIRHPFRTPYEKETLWTLYSLQDGVSCLRHSSSEDSGRGSGTTRFITDFLGLRSRAPEANSVLTLMSGQTRIQLNGDYEIDVKTNSHGDMHKVIAFNDTNDLTKPPDQKVVTFVPQYFPGTLLYADIYLTDEQLLAA